MKKILTQSLFLICLIFGNAFAERYELKTENHCASRTTELSFTCKSVNLSSPAKLIVRKTTDNKWVGREYKNEFELLLVKEDKDVLILNYPVLYSGIANVVIVKATGFFYITEIAYSAVLKQQSYDVESGKFVRID